MRLATITGSPKSPTNSPISTRLPAIDVVPFAHVEPHESRRHPRPCAIVPRPLFVPRKIAQDCRLHGEECGQKIVNFQQMHQRAKNGELNNDAYQAHRIELQPALQQTQIPSSR